jgi:glycosidase
VGQGSHTWFRNKVVTFFNDHDQVSKGQDKARFCADPGAARLLPAALALNLLTLGIPCIYYGTEQAFDGHGSGDGADRYIREAMLGGGFGSFASRGRHFFDESGPAYRSLQALCQLRRSDRVFTRGRQYLRPISGDGVQFGLPMMVGGQLRSLVAWSRLLDDQEVVVVINTDSTLTTAAWVTVEATLHTVGSTLTCVFSSEIAQVGTAVTVEARNGRAVRLEVPAAGFAVYR